MYISHTREQKKLALELEPEFFLHEFLRNYLYYPYSAIIENPEYPLSEKANELLQRELTYSDYPSHDFTKEFRRWLRKSNINIKLNPYESGYFGMDFRGNLQYHLTDPIKSIDLFVGCDLSYIEADLIEEELGVEPMNRTTINAHPEIDRKREERMAEVINLTSPVNLKN